MMGRQELAAIALAGLISGRAESVSAMMAHSARAAEYVDAAYALADAMISKEAEREAAEAESTFGTTA